MLKQFVDAVSTAVGFADGLQCGGLNALASRVEKDFGLAELSERIRALREVYTLALATSDDAAYERAFVLGVRQAFARFDRPLTREQALDVYQTLARNLERDLHRLAAA